MSFEFSEGFNNKITINNNFCTVYYPDVVIWENALQKHYAAAFNK